MRTHFVIAALLLPLVGVAGVYKSVGPDGRIQYSDRPVSGAEPVGIVKIDRGAQPEQAQVPVEEGAADPGPYDGFEIVNPEPNQTVRDAEGKVEIGLLIEPPLSADHRLQLLLNGQTVEGEIQGTQIQLQGLTYGSHSLQARIQDDLDAIIASSAAVDFHMRKPLPEDSNLLE